ncbi:RNA polymerase II-associated protein 3 [Ooceraea biroi]|uniref:RNA polymerase II-associated protein 3 n=1 Tax=Ooceraea biroi TaxID=2015173 RepID=UPI000F098622|nr:RNA polymerase II-associated protein 3 [Ooceraea biroi]
MGNEEVDIISVVQKPEKKSLLERYNIPIEHLSYEFISRCANGKTLERIILILRSGEEGIYPDLTKHAEEHLAKIKPTSAVLRKAEPVLRRNMLNAEERQEIDDDISTWTCEMQSREKDLDEGKATLITDPCSQPEIRKIKSDVEKDKKMRVNEKKHDKPKRITSCDYAAWDKYDADTEINRIDLQDDQRQAEMKRIQQRRKDLDKTNNMAHKTTLNKLSLTGTEVNVLAAQEKEKGNEAFRAADYEEALRHYNASIDIDSNLNAYNNRAMTFIKLQRYEDALNDCNTVLRMDYKNIKGLLRRALSLENLEKIHEALADYEAVLKLEPTNKTAISGVNKLRKPCESRKIRMKIEENVNDGEDKVEQIKSERIVKTNGTERPKQRTNNDICYCDRAPSSSRNVATKPHVKTSYCVETESNKAAAAADAVANKSNGKTTRDSSSGNKLSPVAKDFGGRNKTFTLQDSYASRNEDISTIFPESFTRSRGAEGSLKKSIFSCMSAPRKAKPSSVIIEELPNDETYEKSKGANSGKTKGKMKKETDPKEEKNTSIRESCTSQNKKLSSPAKKNGTLISNKAETLNECKKWNEINDSRETKLEMEKETSQGKEKNALTKKSDIEENKNSFSLEKKSKTETSSLKSNKIHSRNESKESYDRKLEMDLEKLEHIESPYEFLRLWQSLKDATLTLHAKLLRIVAYEDINKIIGNKLDATMLSLILRCLEQQFCTPKDTDLLVNLLCSLSQLNRFSIVCMFMDANDKKALENILRFLEKENSPKVSQLRQIYVT